MTGVGHRERAVEYLGRSRGYEARLLGGVLAICLLLGSLLIFAMHSLSATAREEHALSLRFKDTVVLAQELNEVQRRQDALVPVFAISGEPVVARTIAEANRNFDTVLSALCRSPRASDERQKLELIAEAHQHLLNTQRSGMSLRAQGRSVAFVSRFLRMNAGPLAKALNTAIDTFLDRSSRGYQEAIRRNQSNVRWALRSLGAAAGLAAISCAVILALVLQTLRTKAKQDRLLAELADTERELSTARKEMVETVAHDLKNPLAAITMMAERLRTTDSREQAERHVKLVRGIVSSAESMTLLIRNLLDNAKIAAGPMSMDLQDCDVGAIGRELVARYEFIAETRKLSIGQILPEHLPCVRADDIRVEQVLSNLIGNALKFTPPGGRIELIGSVEDGQLMLCVSDTGIGMMPHQVDHAFDRYWQAPAGAARGTGLGLSISKTIMAAHGGGIDVQSEPGAGSTFRIAFPLQTRQ